MEEKNGEIPTITMVSFGCLISLFFFSSFFDEFIIHIGIITGIPLIAGHFVLKEKDIFRASFWFMLFNLVFIAILIPVLEGAMYLDVIFPMSFFYFFASPFFFSLGGLIKKDLHLLIPILLILAFQTSLYYIPYTRRYIYSPLRLFYLYNAFLVINQVWRVLKKKRSKGV